MKQSAAPSDCFIIVVQEQKHWNQGCDSKETLEMKQSRKLNRERGRGWGLGGGGNVVLYKAQMVLEKHVTEKWGDGGIRKEECVSGWLTRGLQHLGRESDIRVSQGMKFNTFPQASANMFDTALISSINL